MAKKKKKKKKTASRRDRLRRRELDLREFALGYPESHEDDPWGERAFKVRKKVFVFMSREQDHLSFSAKLPDSREDALAHPFAEPTHYGLGRHGWVTFRFEPGDSLPASQQLEDWIDESFRAVAPKKLIAQLDALDDVS